MPNNQDPVHETRVRKFGNSYYLLLKKPIRKFLSLGDGDDARLQHENGKHGKYASFWNPEQQENE